MVFVVNSCALYGATSYANNWISVNVLVVLISLLLVAVAYSLSNIFPPRTGEKIKGAARSELTQGFLSIIIIVVLIGTTLTACSISSTISTSLTGKSQDPFSYATYYIGNLSVNTGVNLLTTLYSTSVQYSIESTILTTLGNLLNGPFNTLLGKVAGIFKLIPGVKPSVTGAIDLGVVFQDFSGLYLGFASFVTIAVGLLFVQWILLPLFKLTAFTVILPVALAMRSLAFLGSHVRFASNAILAIAIAAYIIYPVMIAFNSYAISWIFSANNPSSQYIKSTYIVPNITPNSFFQNTVSADSGFFGSTYSSLYSLVSSVFTNPLNPIPYLSLPFEVISQAQFIVNQIAQFLFASVIMIVIDLSVTVGFAIGLTNALNAGVEGTGNFWSGL